MNAAAGAFHVVLLAPVRDDGGRVIDARIDFADDAWRSKLSGGADPTGHSLRRYLGDDVTRLDAIRRALELGGTLQTEFRRPTAPERVAEVQLTPLEGRIIATGREITTERALRVELERSRAELIAAQKLASMGSWVWDPRSDRADWSDTMLAIYGLAPGTPTPSFAEQERFYDAETLARTSSLIARVTRTGEPYSMEYDLVRDDGQRRHVIAHGESILVDGVFAGLRGTVVDITELHEARQRLLQSEQRFSTVLRAVRESVAILRPERGADGELSALRIEWVNAAWASLWEISGDVVGEDAYTILPVMLAFRALHRQVLESGGPHELSVTLAGGKVVEATLVAMDERIVAVGRDVTAVRRTLQALEVRRHADQLVALAGGIAHQLNNALMGIVGHTEQLATTVRDSADVAAILAASDRAATLTRHLLAYAQRQSLQPVSFAIAPFVSRLGPVLRAAVGDAVEIRLEIDDEDAWVSFDPQQLELVLLELVRNARDAMPEGGTITIATEARPPFVRLSIADSGRGIASEHLPHLFDPFFVVGTLGATSGLGLSSVHGTMEQSGGRVTVESQPGRTVFTLHLPEGTPDQPQTTRSDVTLAAHANILVVDDDELVRRAVMRSLRGLGYTVREASSAAEALAVLAEEDVEVLLTDVMMPIISGTELAERARAVHPRIAVVFMSGFAALALEADGALPRGAMFLAKPFRRPVLREMVELARRTRAALP